VGELSYRNTGLGVFGIEIRKKIPSTGCLAVIPLDAYFRTRPPSLAIKKNRRVSIHAHKTTRQTFDFSPIRESNSEETHVSDFASLA